jgi:hypothetical protein
MCAIVFAIYLLEKGENNQTPYDKHDKLLRKFDELTNKTNKCSYLSSTSSDMKAATAEKMMSSQN